MTSTKKRNFRH